ncbi:MAG: hypothetical protein ABIT71_05905 [Vicinamibacteraceae bacterium]
MTRRTTYRVAGASLLVETRDAWSAEAIDALFPGWYLTQETDGGGTASTPAITLESGTVPGRIPARLTEFAVAGGGTCYTDGRASYIDIEGSVVAIGLPERADVEVWIDGPLPLESPALTRLVTYALSAALRQQRRYELHSGAVVDPRSGTGVLMAGPSGSGKSTMAVHLASAGWPFLTDDVLLLGRDADGVTAWPLRRRFAITSATYAASRFLQDRTALDAGDVQQGKRPFAPHDVFAGGFRDHCQPGVLLFPELSGAARSDVERLTPGDTMARLIRLNPWSCYDRTTAPGHLSVLSALTRQVVAFSVRAGRDVLDAAAAVALVDGCVRQAVDR